MGREPLRRGLCAGGGYLSPAFLTFSIDAQPNPLEVGDSSGANPTFLWTTRNPANIVANSIAIDDITGSTNIATGLANTGSYAATYGALTKTAATTYRFRISGQNTLAGTFTRNFDLLWQWKGYYGESALTSLTEAQVKALRVGALISGFAGTYVFLGGGYKYIAYPAALGLATRFVDQATGFTVAMDTVYTLSVTNSFGVTTTYRVHRTYNELGGPINIVVS